MDLVRQFEILGSKQLAIQEGMDLLRQIQQELVRNKTAADVWGFTAVMANLTIIPLNIIVNAFELKAANSAYQSLVKFLYLKYI